jgi:hypothetical protein
VTDEAPGIDLSRRRSLGGILRAAAAVYRRYPLLFLLLAAAVIVPADLIVLTITGHGPLRRGHESAGTFLLIDLVRSSLISPLVSALHIHALVMIGRTERPRLPAVARQGIATLPVVAAAAIISSLGISLGFLLLVIPGLSSRRSRPSSPSAGQKLFRAAAP